MPQTIVCVCKKRLQVLDHLAGKRIKCPGCGHFHTVPLLGPKPVPADHAYTVVDDAAKRPPSNCPGCGQGLPAGAVLCVGCGLDLRSGEKVKVQAADPSETDPDTNVTKQKPKKRPKVELGSRNEAMAILSGPARWLYVTATVFFWLCVLALAGFALERDLFHAGTALVFIPWFWTIRLGAKRMGYVESYGLALAACIMSIVVIPWLWLSIPGIIALVRLLRKDVRLQFRGWW